MKTLLFKKMGVAMPLKSSIFIGLSINLLKKRLILLGVTLVVWCFSKSGYCQTLTIDNSAPRTTAVASNGQNLSATTYNYVYIPELLAFDSLKTDGTFYKHLMMTWGMGTETASPQVPPKNGFASSVNSGASWVKLAHDMRLGSSLKLKSGKILSLAFRPTYVDQRDFPLVYWTSVNNGATWTKHTDGMISFPQNVLGIRMHKSLLEEPDGTLYTSAYVRYSFSTTFRTYVLKSIDGGKTWLPMLNGSGAPIEITGTAPTDEGSLVRCADGSWLMVMKQVSTDPDITAPLLYSKSTNKGQSWTTPAQLPGAGSAASGKNPHVVLMPNGVLALTYGTPDCEITFSANNGNTWTTPTSIYPDPGGTKRPSGNTWIAPIGRNMLLNFGDNYAKTLNPNTQAIWQKQLQIVRPEQNRIDLKTKQAIGAVTIMPTTTLNYTTSTHAEARTTAAFDGSTDYWSSAIGTNGGVLQLDLQKTYRINSIGLAMLYNTQQSATVEYSTDGSTWSSSGVSYSNTVHCAVHYTSVNIAARYIRVTVNGTGQIGIGELELYEASLTFEGNAVSPSSVIHGVLPPGMVKNTATTEYGVSILDGVGYQSSRGLKLYDGSSGWAAGVKKNDYPQGNARTLEFRARLAALPTGNSINMAVMGVVGASYQTVFWICLEATSTTSAIIKRNSGSGWVQLGTATVGINGTAWNHYKIVANRSANTATVFLNGVQLGSSFGMYAAAGSGTNLSGFSFNSQGTAPTGQLAYFDDVNFYDPAVGGPSGIAGIASKEMILQSQEDFSSQATKEALTNKDFSIVVSPNPAHHIVNLSIQNTVSGELNLLFTDMSGKQLRRTSSKVEGGMAKLEIPVDDLAPGIYVIQARQNNQISSTKLIIE